MGNARWAQNGPQSFSDSRGFQETRLSCAPFALPADTFRTGLISARQGYEPLGYDKSIPLGNQTAGLWRWPAGGLQTSGSAPSATASLPLNGVKLHPLPHSQLKPKN